MPILLDTNILVELVRNDPEYIKSKINPKQDVEYISVVTYAEIHSLAWQLEWTGKKKKKLDDLLAELVVFDINEKHLIDKYIDIDTYSKFKHPSIKSKHKGAVRMGKNDLWIAATAAALKVSLFTTDKDFDHLHNVFVDVKSFKPEELKKPSK
jgi:tRNA(fMet)-specific endonuclease VapC